VCKPYEADHKVVLFATVNNCHKVAVRNLSEAAKNNILFIDYSSIR